MEGVKETKTMVLSDAIDSALSVRLHHEIVRSGSPTTTDPSHWRIQDYLHDQLPEVRIASFLLASTALAATATALTVVPASAAASPKASAACRSSSASSVRVDSPATYAARLVALTNQAREGRAAGPQHVLLPCPRRQPLGRLHGQESQQIAHPSLNNLAAACPGGRTVGKNIAKATSPPT